MGEIAPPLRFKPNSLTIVNESSCLLIYYKQSGFIVEISGD
jgi:hypothetical protein